MLVYFLALDRSTRGERLVARSRVGGRDARQWLLLRLFEIPRLFRLGCRTTTWFCVMSVPAGDALNAIVQWFLSCLSGLGDGIFWQAVVNSVLGRMTIGGCELWWRVHKTAR